MFVIINLPTALLLVKTFFVQRASYLLHPILYQKELMYRINLDMADAQKRPENSPDAIIILA